MDEDGYRDEDGAGDDPAAAFERLRGEISLLRLAVGSLATARETIEIPDYEPTLARTERILTVLTEQLEPIVESPMLAMTPPKMANEIVSAALHARREDQRLLTEGRAALDQATRDMRQMVASARTGEEQNRWIFLYGIGGLVVGIVVWAVFAGIVARAMPASWHWPERMAARTLDTDMWDAGQRLASVANPDGWRGIVAGDAIVRANHDAIEACRKSAAKAKKAVRCAIDVKAGE